jgi:hypothetical protein
MLAAAGELRHAHPVLARLSARSVRSLVRPYFAAGWTVGDVLHALYYRPSATCPLPSMPLGRVYAPAGWARSRLAAWRDDTGRVLPGWHQRRAALDDARAKHGQAAAAALPDGQLALTPKHVLAHADRATQRAGDTQARNHRREAAARHSGLVPYDQHGPADPRRDGHREPPVTTRTRAEAMTAIRDTLARRRRPRDQRDEP